MDDQGFPAALRGADVGAESFPLPFGVAGLPVVVQPGLSDRDDLRRGGQITQSFYGGFLTSLVIGMNAHRRVYALVLDR